MKNQEEETDQDTNKKQPKYKKLNLMQKLAIINHVKGGGPQVKIAAHFGVSSSTISRVFKRREKYKLSPPKRKIMENRTRIDKGKHFAVEELLFEWMEQERSLGTCISGPMLQEKALFFNEQLKGPESFKASQGWLNRFKKRYGIRLVGAQKDGLSVDKAAAIEFKEEFETLIEEGQHSLDSARGDESAAGGTDLENETNLMELYEGFNRFKAWYERRTDCTKEEASNLNHMQSVVEGLLAKKMFRED